MALLNIGAGLAAAGAAISQTVGVLTIEQQRAEQEERKIKLADELAGARDEKQRGFLTKERTETQAFTSGEKALDRTHAEKLASEARATTLQAAGISAGASIAGARMQIEARREDAKLDREFRAEETRLAREENRPFKEAQVQVYTAEALQKTVAAQAAKEVQDAREDMRKATEANDTEAITAAQRRMAIATYSTQETVQQATVARGLADQYRLMANEVRAKMEAAADLAKGGMTPENQQRVKNYQAELAKLEARWRQAVEEADALAKSMPRFNSGTPRAETSTPTPTPTFRYDSKGNRIKD